MFSGLCIFSAEPENSEGQPDFEAFGAVRVDPQHPMYVGAQRESNNTGELQAIAELFLYILEHIEEPHIIKVGYDSKIAANMAVIQTCHGIAAQQYQHVLALLACVQQEQAQMQQAGLAEEDCMFAELRAALMQPVLKPKYRAVLTVR